MTIGALGGLTAIGWYIVLEEALLTYGAWMSGYVLVAAGCCVKPSRRRIAMMILLMVLMLWPSFADVVLGDHPWE